MDKAERFANRARQWLSQLGNRVAESAVKADDRVYRWLDPGLSKFADRVGQHATDVDHWGCRRVGRVRQHLTSAAGGIGATFATWGWLATVAVVAIIIAILTFVVGELLTDGYRDSLHRWTAWAAILAGATVAIAVLGLPVALYQLATVRRDLNRVTRASEFEQGLGAFLLEGVDLLDRFHRGDSPEMRTEFAGWVEVVAQYIRRQTGNEVEEKLFRLDARSLRPRDQLEKKILHLRDDLMPRVRAGYV